MDEIDISHAQANLSLLIDKAVRGEPFLITRFGTALVKVEAVASASASASASAETLPRLGFLTGQFTIPEDFGASDPQIEKLFYGGK